jgi:hypothetical protein
MYVSLKNADVLDRMVIKQQPQRKGDPVERHDICYRDGETTKALYLHPVYEHGDVSTGVFTMGVTKGRGKYHSDRMSVALLPDMDNKDERGFVELLDAVAMHISNIKAVTIRSPVTRYMRGETSGISVWCNIIQSSGGVVYTRAYDATRKELDVPSLSTFMRIRPAVRLTLVYNKGVHSLKCTITEFCVMEMIAGGSSMHMLPT